MGRTNRLATIIIIIFLLFSNFKYSYGDNNFNVDRNIYLIVINKLTLSDIDKMPNLKGIMEEGSFGLMNVRGTSGYRGAESFITINASNKAFANNESSQFHNLDEEFKKTYENRVGPLDKEYEVGNIQIGRLYNQNENNRYSPYLGSLGDLLHNGGLKTAIFGNSDTEEELIRTAALIPMDSNGRIDYGNLDKVLIEDEDYPYGMRTDYNKILDEISKIKSKASLIVVDTGDLNRLNSYENLLSDDIFYQKRNIILKNIDSFVGSLLSTIDKDKSLLMIVSPNSGEERIDGNRLSPIILWGKEVSRGMPISSTTNRPGIISNLDISPTIVGFFNLKIENMSGNIINCIEKDNSFNYVKTINGRINLMSKVRSKTLLIYGTLGIIVMLIILVLFLFKINLNNRIGKWFKIILLLLYKLPIIFIISSLFTIDNLFKFVLSLVLLIILFIYIYNKYFSNRIIYLITYSYFIIIVIDILSNGFFTKYSVMSHDPIIGARYFGIGNEMVGLFLTGTVLTAGLLYEKYNNKIVTILVLSISVILVGHPKLGANVGGTIALISASIYFILDMMNKELSFKNIVLIIVVASLMVIILGYIDVKLNPNPTHLGRTILSINDNGLGIVKNIMNRKLLMNIRLVGISIWTKVIIINIFIQMVMSILFEYRISKLMNSKLGKGLLSSIVGSIVGFLVNDSGLILSAITINLITIFMLFSIIDYEE